MHIFESVDEVAEEARSAGFDLEYVQLGRGKYAGAFPAQTHSQSVFIDESHSVGIGVNGTMFDDTWMVVCGHDQLSFNGRQTQQNELIVYMPGSELDMTTRGAMRAPQICMPATLVDKHLNAAGFEPVNLGNSGPVRIPVSTNVCNWFNSTARLLANSDDADDGLARNMEHQVLGYLATLDEQSLGEKDLRGRGRPVEYYEQTFSLALDYIHANIRSRIALDELCRATDTSLRTLQRVFMKRVGMSPRKYTLTCKLNAIRRDLIDGSPQALNVSDVARAYGITHMGRFSAAYHSQFGEYPRNTLAR